MEFGKNHHHTQTVNLDKLSIAIKPMDAQSSKLILVTPLYMFSTASLLIIRSYLLYNQHWHI